MAKTSTATGALEAYRRSLLTGDVEEKIAELAQAVAAHESNEATRQRELDKLTATKWWSDEESLSAFVERARSIAEKGWRDQDAVLNAFEAAKAAGAKPATLHEIGLRPDATLTAARARAKNTGTRTSTPQTARAGTAGEPTSGGDAADATHGGVEYANA